MSLLPNTTCRRCHRQYPSIRSRCPYCGTRKAREVRSAVPETDSAVPGTQAARNAAETINWQMLIGGVLLIAVFLVTIILVSVNVKSHVTETVENAEPTADINATPLPTSTPVPTPTASPTPVITSISVRWSGNPTIDSYIPGGFTERAGVPLEMRVYWYPQDIKTVPVWTSSDESIATVTPSEDGQSCMIELVGESGQSATISVDVGGFTGEHSFPVYVR